MAALQDPTCPNTPTSTTAAAAEDADADTSGAGQLQAVCGVEQADVVPEAGLHDGCGTSLQLMQRATSMPVAPDPGTHSDSGSIAGEYCMRLVGRIADLLSCVVG